MRHICRPPRASAGIFGHRLTGRRPPVRWNAGFTLSQLILIGFFVSIATSPAPAREVYKWVDEKGVVHYGDRAPLDGGRKVEKIQSALGSTDTYNDTWSSFMEEDRHNKQQKLLDKMKSDREGRAKARADRVAAVAAKKDRSAACERAKVELQNQLRSAYLYRTNEAGERVVLDDEARAREEQKVRAQISNHCG